ncbi:MAG TPA: pyruvate synthase, partial [bacterium]|nr:pyruvate synthase [bacterium]
MIEIRFHGRGGQGAVTSAELVALAAIEQGR